MSSPCRSRMRSRLAAPTKTANKRKKSKTARGPTGCPCRPVVGACPPEIRSQQEAFGEISKMRRDLAAEFVGTFSLVSAVCGSALFSAPQAGLMAIAFAVGLSVMAMAFAVGHISGAHFNPAVTCGLVVAGRFPAQRAIAYIVVQVIGGADAAGIFFLVLMVTLTAK